MPGGHVLRRKALQQYLSLFVAAPMLVTFGIQLKCSHNIPLSRVPRKELNLLINGAAVLVAVVVTTAAVAHHKNDVAGRQQASEEGSSRMFFDYRVRRQFMCCCVGYYYALLLFGWWWWISFFYTVFQQYCCSWAQKRNRHLLLGGRLACFLPATYLLPVHNNSVFLYTVLSSCSTRLYALL